MPTITESKRQCVLVTQDGSGSYCTAINVKHLEAAGRLKDYPHMFFRTDCWGSFDQCPFKKLFHPRKPT